MAVRPQAVDTWAHGLCSHPAVSNITSGDIREILEALSHCPRPALVAQAGPKNCRNTVNLFFQFYHHAGSAECELMASRCSSHVQDYAVLIFYLGKTASTANRTCRFNDFIIAVEVL